MARLFQWRLYKPGSIPFNRDVRASYHTPSCPARGQVGQGNIRVHQHG
jgi:hypothetical protein